MIRLVHKIASWFLKRRVEQIEHFIRYPQETQEGQLLRLIERAQLTSWGEKYGYADIQSLEAFRQQVPISSYESFYPYLERAFKGESNVIWPGTTEWFAKSSGTTNDKSKFIPVTDESLSECHFRAGQDMLGVYFHNHPESKLFTGKSLGIGGSHELNRLHGNSRYGDVSAIIVENLPRFFELIRTPSKEIALMPEWDSKVVAMAREVMYEDVTGIAGVPTWTLVLIHYILDDLGISSGDLRAVWPNLELYIHGGVSFVPYREQFKQLIPHTDMNYLEVYNASEGFFAIQNEADRDDLLLMLDYGIFYEFIRPEDLYQEHPRTYVLDEIELGVNYAMVISTNGGLWRYLIGDTVTFTSRNPYKLKITGRTKHFINAFGEELIVDNAEQAISDAAHQTGAIVENYTAAPIYLQGKNKGGHEWLIEFKRAPDDLNAFAHILDQQLKRLNSDYEAKRVGDLALGMPRIHALPAGTFYEWMRKRNKLGGQNKVPRLYNNRKYVEDILNMLAVNRQ